MPTLQTCRTGIDVQHIQRLVKLHFQNMTMTRHEQLRRIGIEHATNAVVVVARIATDVFDEHVDILYLKTIKFAIHQPQVTAVAIATNGTERSERCQFLCHLHTADITGVPYLVAGLEIV